MCLAAAVLWSTALVAGELPVNVGFYSGVANHGYDVVTYWTEGKAVPGDEAFSVEHQGVPWYFASAANRDLFAADPDKYRPEYNGHCAYAMAQGELSDVDPVAWQIHDGKLYLNYDNKVQRLWAGKIEEHIRLGDSFWPETFE